MPTQFEQPERSEQSVVKPLSNHDASQRFLGSLWQMPRDVCQLVSQKVSPGWSPIDPILLIGLLDLLYLLFGSFLGCLGHTD